MKASELLSAAGLDEIQDLNLIAAEVAGEPVDSSPHLLPGLEEANFLHDGQITKKEIRILTLAALGPMPKNLLWDVGAGAGSISIEWLRVDSSLGAIAVEPREERVENLVRNRLSLGVPRLQVVQGRAPECLEGLGDPDAIFVGGGLSEPGVLEACWERLKPGGRLVSNAVTLEGEAALVSFSKKCGGELIRLEVSRAEPIGRFGTWRPQKPITQLRAFKDGP